MPNFGNRIRHTARFHFQVLPFAPKLVEAGRVTLHLAQLRMEASFKANSLMVRSNHAGCGQSARDTGVCRSRAVPGHLRAVDSRRTGGILGVPWRSRMGKFG